MSRSVNYYKELLKFSEDIRDNYLKNVSKFKNQLRFEDINLLCYQKLYEEIKSIKDIKPLNKFYDEINGLKTLNNEAYKYYLSPRNKSIKGLDVQLGNKFDNAFMDFLKSLGIKVNDERADIKNKRLPDIKILDNTRNIKAYIEHKYHNAPFMFSKKKIGRETYEGSITMDTKKLQKQLIEIESELEDRPVYFVHWVDFHHLKGVFFNTQEQIKSYLNANPIEFSRYSREGDYKLQSKIGYTEKFYPPLHEMGDLEELIKKLIE